MPRKSTTDTGSGTNSKKPVKDGGVTSDTNTLSEINLVSDATWESDTITGTDGNDIITGIPANGNLTQGGSNQVDILSGGGGADTFILGDSRGAFYTHGDPNTYGSGSYGDYAIITDFNPDEGDRIQLHDNATYLILYAQDISDADGDGNFAEGVYELYEYKGFFGVEPMAYIFTEDGVYNPESIAQYFVAASGPASEPSLIEM